MTIPVHISRIFVFKTLGPRRKAAGHRSLDTTAFSKTPSEVLLHLNLVHTSLSLHIAFLWVSLSYSHRDCVI